LYAESLAAEFIAQASSNGKKKSKKKALLSRSIAA